MRDPIERDPISETWRVSDRMQVEVWSERQRGEWINRYQCSAVQCLGDSLYSPFHLLDDGAALDPIPSSGCNDL